MLRLIEGGFSSGSFDLLKKRIGECVIYPLPIEALESVIEEGL